jgi:hypothetical protein
MPKQRPNKPKGPFDPIKQTRFDFEYAKRCILQDNTVMPLFIVHAPDIVVPIGFSGGGNYDGKGKEGHRIMTRLVCIAHNAYAVAYIGEAWIATSLPGEPDPEFPRVPPRDREDKREVIIVNMMWRNDDTGERLSYMAQGEIVRNDKGKCIRVDKEEFSEPTTMLVGNFAEILPPRPTTEEERQAALQLLERYMEQGAVRKTDLH